MRLPASSRPSRPGARYYGSNAPTTDPHNAPPKPPPGHFKPPPPPSLTKGTPPASSNHGPSHRASVLPTPTAPALCDRCRPRSDHGQTSPRATRLQAPTWPARAPPAAHHAHREHRLRRSPYPNHCGGLKPHQGHRSVKLCPRPEPELLPLPAPPLVPNEMRALALGRSSLPQSPRRSSSRCIGASLVPMQDSRGLTPANFVANLPRVLPPVKVSPRGDATLLCCRLHNACC